MNTSVTIIISHFNSLPFLRACVRQIRKHRHPKIDQHIIISDQSNDENYRAVIDEFLGTPNLSIVQMQPLWSGYGIDYIIRNKDIQTDYICQLHTDCFPIHKNWLYMTTQLMEKQNLTFAGVLQFVCNNPNQTTYYYKNPFFSMAQSFHVGRTDVYKEMSFNGGFTRFHNREKVKDEMTWNCNDWADWAKHDYLARGSDDDVLAFNWQDNYRQHDKMGFGLTGIMGITSEGEVGYGSIIEDMVFHFGFHLESRGVMNEMGAKYRSWMERINTNGFTEELLDEMLIVARANPQNPVVGRTLWDGKLKEVKIPDEKMNKLIEKLKK